MFALVVILLFIQLYDAEELMNSDIKLAIPQAQVIYEDAAILGGTTRFNYPLSVGTGM